MLEPSILLLYGLSLMLLARRRRFVIVAGGASHGPPRLVPARAGKM